MEKIKSEITKKRVEEFIEIISDIASLNFNKRLEVKGDDSHEDILCHGLNMLADEWEDTVTSKERLTQSEKKYAQLFQNSYDSIFIFDAKTARLIDANKQALKLLGVHIEDLDRIQFSDLLRFDSIDFDKLIERIIEDGGNTFIKDRLQLNKKESIAIEFSACIVSLNNEELLQLNLRDISEQQKILNEKDRLFKQIRNSENQYRNLFESSSLGILLVEPTTGAIINANKAMEKILGYTPNELQDLSIHELVPPHLTAELRIILEVLDKTGQLTIETERLSKEGKLVPVEITLSMTIYGDAIPVIISNIRDISERKQNELIRRVTYNIANKVNNKDTSLSELCAYIQAELSGIMLTENFYIALTTEGEDITFHYLEDEHNMLETPFSRPKSNGLTEYIADNKKTIRLVGGGVTEFLEKHEITPLGEQPKSWLGAPIMCKGEAIGVVACQSYSDPYAYLESHEQLLSLLGSEIGMFLERVKASQERERILTLSQDLICIAGFDGYFKYVNPACSNVLGWDEEELLSRPFLSFTHVDDQEKTVSEVGQLVQGQGTVSFTNRYYHKDGSIRILSWFATPIVAEGTIYAIARDITEQQSTINELAVSEKKYRGLFDKMNDGLLFSDPEGIIETVNPSLCNILGYSPMELVGKIGYEFLLAEDNREEIRSKVEERKTGASSIYELEFVHKSGRIVWANVSAYPHYDTEGNFKGVMTIISDISHRKEIEKEREQAYVQLKNSEEQLRFEHQSVLQYQSMLLSSQLNPHFIFNSLNSIQYHILEKDPEPSLMFLSNFAKLMRRVLRNSTHRYITIQDEVEFLGIYMDLEKSRHKNKFDYAVSIDDEIDEADIYIPPMLIQPYVENSIIHGIGHLVEGGLIELKFTLESENSMMCIITDNGIGRKEAEKRNILKEGEKNSHSSFINQNRIDILNKLEGSGYSMKIKDLQENGEPIGTSVIIIFPLILEE